MSRTDYIISVNGRHYVLREKGLRLYHGDPCSKCALRKGCKKDNLNSKIYRMCYHLDGLGFRTIKNGMEIK